MMWMWVLCIVYCEVVLLRVLCCWGLEDLGGNWAVAFIDPWRVLFTAMIRGQGWLKMYGELMN